MTIPSATRCPFAVQTRGTRHGTREVGMKPLAQPVDNDNQKSEYLVVTWVERHVFAAVAIRGKLPVRTKLLLHPTRDADARR